eukprot:365649-Chlamydomonas_euryale.AAC.1
MGDTLWTHGGHMGDTLWTHGGCWPAPEGDKRAWACHMADKECGSTQDREGNGSFRPDPLNTVSAPTPSTDYFRPGPMNI